MHQNNIKNVTELKNYYFTNIFNMTRNLKTVPIVWEEIFDENIQLDPNVVVQVWKSDYNYSIVSEASIYIIYIIYKELVYINCQLLIVFRSK